MTQRRPIRLALAVILLMMPVSLLAAEPASGQTPSEDRTGIFRAAAA